MMKIFQYGEKEIAHLKRVDKRLGAIIDRMGRIERTVIPDLFTALVHAIVGQQISTGAHRTVWGRIASALGEISPELIDRLPSEVLQRFGLTFKKTAYIKAFAHKVANGEFDPETLRCMTDDEVCAKLVEQDGVGRWTAEMLMIFSMQRPNVLSYGDLAIRRGLRMVYRRREIDRDAFNRYWKRYTPYASTASLYLWAVAGGAIEGMKDFAPPPPSRKSRLTPSPKAPFRPGKQTPRPND